MLLGKSQERVAVLYIVSDIPNAQLDRTDQFLPVCNMPLEIKQHSALFIICDGLQRRIGRLFNVNYLVLIGE